MPVLDETTKTYQTNLPYFFHSGVILDLEHVIVSHPSGLNIMRKSAMIDGEETSPHSIGRRLISLSQ